MACKNCCTGQDNDHMARRRRYHDPHHHNNNHHQQQHSYNFDSFQTSGGASDEIEYMRQQMGELRRDNNRMLMEATYLRKENTLYLKRLKEEHIVRERYENKIEFRKKLLAKRRRSVMIKLSSSMFNEIVISLTNLLWMISPFDI